jgi:hypothetical protein
VVVLMAVVLVALLLLLLLLLLAITPLPEVLASFSRLPLAAVLTANTVPLNQAHSSVS